LEEDDGVDLHGHVVRGDDLLLRDLERDNAQVRVSRLIATKSVTPPWWW
jgi:hypothetical protein